MAYPEVIRVFATSQDPDFDGPWQARTPSNSTGSAVVIGPGLLLTGAHVVANATFLQVQKPSQPDKAIARVRAVSHDSDLALLEVVEPPDFLDDIEPARLGPMPRLRDEVPGWLPISFRDWAGREVARTYCDEYGTYNALIPSTYTVNAPARAASCPICSR